MELSYRVNTAGIQRKVDFYGMDKVSKFFQSFIDTNVFDYTLNLDFFDLEYQNLFLQNLWDGKRVNFLYFESVLRHLVMRILDVPSYDPEKVKATCVVTLHQFLQYFKDEGGLQNVDAVAAECKC